MISAYAKGFQVLNDARYLEAASKAAQFIYDKLYNKETKTLIRNYREGPSNIAAFSDDYSFLIAGLLGTLHNNNFSEELENSFIMHSHSCRSIRSFVRDQVD